jgi:hypothetical protein
VDGVMFDVRCSQNRHPELVSGSYYSNVEETKMLKQVQHDGLGVKADGFAVQHDGLGVQVGIFAAQHDGAIP